jgi:hypothetical protein
MAAPQAAAALSLLQSQWAILRTNGTTAKLLEATTTDLGTAGADAVYGNGLMNIDKAMQPYGTLTVVNAQKQSVPLNNITGKVILGGAFGATSGGKLSTSLQTALSNYTTFDGFGRNYTVNLASLVTGTTGSSSSIVNAVTAPKATTSAAKFADGSSVAFGNITPTEHDISRPDSMQDRPGWFMAFTDVAGSTMAAGYGGFPAAASFNDALWGNDNAVSGQVFQLGASSALSNIAQGGTFFAYGANVDATTRIAFSWSSTQEDDGFSSADNSQSSAKSFNTGINGHLTNRLRGGITMSLLDQKNGLLDSSYSGDGIGLGDNHKSVSVGVSSSYALSNTRDIVVDAAIMRTDGARMSDGLISGVTPTYARSLGVGLVQRDAMDKGDSLNIALRAPMRVISGSASMVSTSVDDDGLPVSTTQKIGLKPDGQEVSLSLGYQSAVKEGASWSLSLEGRNDANNVAGEKDATAMIRTKLEF